MTVITPGRQAEAQSFLDANPSIESFHLIWTDLVGIHVDAADATGTTVSGTVVAARITADGPVLEPPDMWEQYSDE